MLERGTDNANILTANVGLFLTISHLVLCLKSQKTNRDKPVSALSVAEEGQWTSQIIKDSAIWEASETTSLTVCLDASRVAVTGAC